MNKLLGVLLLMIVSTSCFSWNVFGPKNYDECILENMKGVNTDVGARLVNNSCREKFTEKEVVSRSKHNWTKYGILGELGVIYRDISTFKKYDKIVTVTVMRDFNKVQEGKYNVQYSSDISDIEMDCNKLNFRILMSVKKSGHMGDGEVVETSNVIQEVKDHEGLNGLCIN